MSKQSDQRSVGSAPFARLAARYDAWFDGPRGRRVFDAELKCIRGLLHGLPRPWLEVGVGTGRFAAALGVDEGVDPESAVLRYASRRGIPTRLGRGEELPYEGDRFGVALLIVTICFLTDPARALGECRRVLRNDGYAIVGLVPKDSRWGQAYAREGAQGHPFYSVARFLTARQVIGLAGKAGFRMDRARSCLVEGPEQKVEKYVPARDELVKGAGFVAMRFERKETLSA